MNTSWTLGTNYAFDQDGTGNQDNIYIYLSTSTPISNTPFTVTGNLAYEDGAFGANKWDWLLGLSYAFTRFSLSVNYIDTANSGTNAGSAGVVGMLSASF
jgi:predicted porin